jgi:4-diphosphocytidyl-2-C-methyl-D-erythritol kinase
VSERRAAASLAGAESWWPAPAKLNLFLHIIGRRHDGYHELQTVFQLIDLCDELQFELRAAPAISRDISGSGAGELAREPAASDLAVRAAAALQQATGYGGGVHIHIRKRIPHGGGLGGGSSDAATTLLALNQLWQTGLKIGDLAVIGRKIGADVAVFVHGASAWAEGVGDRLTPIALPQRWFLIIDPGVRVATAEVFQASELTRNSSVITIRAFFESGGRNDCEPVVRARVPVVAEALDWLSAHAPARLTGTGSCIYAAFPTAAAAERIAARVPDEWKSFVAQGLQHSPLLARVSARSTPA